MSHRVNVSSAEFIRNIGYWQNEALRQPISITHHGRERLVLAAPDAFQADVGSTDITKLLSTLRADVSLVQDTLDDCYLSVDSHLCIRNSNLAAEAFIGMSRDDLVGVSLASVLSQPLASILSDRVQRVIRSRQAERFEVGATDGRYFAVTVFPISVGAAALLRNITEIHVLRRRLEDGDALQQAVRVHDRAAAIKLDAHACVETIDDEFTAWTGFESADLVGHRLFDLVLSAQRRAAAETIECVFREGRPRSISLTLLGKRGDEVEGVLAIAPILTDFVAHGALAIFVPSEAAGATQRAA